MSGKFQHYYNRLREQLWFRPFLFCLFSVAVALVAQLADDTFLEELVPDIAKGSIEELLKTISASMLVIAIFAVASMLSAFSAASSSATPRSFKLVITDDVSQNALSVFIGAFIFSIVATVALQNGYYAQAGRFILFVLTLVLFAVVILTFLRWVDRISRLGRLEHTIKRVEGATAQTMQERLDNPNLGGLPRHAKAPSGTPIYGSAIGYVQFVNMSDLQELGDTLDAEVLLDCLPGNFISPNQPLAYVALTDGSDREQVEKRIRDAVVIDDSRSFTSDPRFGIIALSEIASRALSPGINDPGTAIQVLGSHIRLFALFGEVSATDREVSYDRVRVPQLEIRDLLEDAFRPIARDGAGNIEVMLHLQKALVAIASIDYPGLREGTRFQSREALERAKAAMAFPPDLELLRRASTVTE